MRLKSIRTILLKVNLKPFDSVFWLHLSSSAQQSTTKKL